MQYRTWTIAAVTILLGTLVTAANADPVGTRYGLELTLFRPAEPFPIALERHAAEDIPFDESEKVGILTHIAPNPDVDNDLNVTEDATPNATGEEITIWIEGQQLLAGGGRVPLFTEVEPQNGDGVRFIADNLFWTDFGGTAEVNDLLFVVTFPNLSQIAIPFDLTIAGDGTAANPLSIRADFDAAVFNPSGTGTPEATDFHASFTVAHVPEPSSLLLAALGLLALVACGHRCRRE